MRFPVVLLHAFPLDSRMWDDVRSSVDGLITPDQRGFGTAPLGDAPPDLAVAAADVISMLDGRRVVLGGCSMGGYVAMAVLRAAPSLVAGLVLVDTRAAADTPVARENRLAAAERAEAEGVDWIPSAMLPVLLGSGADPAVVERTRALILEQDPAAVAWAQRAMADRPDSGDLLRSSEVPALIVRGADDELIPRAEAEALGELLPSAQVVELSGAGHLPPLEKPAEFARVLRDWLAG
jgi:pimeloyl-ACP methyl ester carboxylesterase